MSNLQERAAEARGKMEKSNPSTTTAKTVAERKRVPLSLPQSKLAVPEIPGYHTHWFRGTQARLQAAQAAFYEFVHPSEVDLNYVGVGGDAAKSGNSDLGDRVSILEGSEVENGQAVRLYLMKQKMEYYLEDRKILQDRNDSIADALTAAYRKGAVGGRAEGETAEDAQRRYVDKSRTKVPDLFRKKGR